MRLRQIATSLVNILTTIVCSFLGARLLFKMFNANGNGSFVNWVYETTDVLLKPFGDIFNARVINNQYVIEFTTLFALVLFLIIGLLMVWLIELITPASKLQVVTVDRAVIAKKVVAKTPAKKTKTAKKA